MLSRREAQARCRREKLDRVVPGDVLDARITHLEAFGAFADIGCGIVALMPIDMISVSRIHHPRDRFRVGMDIRAVVRSTENGRITLSQRELLGTWLENASRFSSGETVAGIVRSVEPYGTFVELAPNLAGLAEKREGVIPGQQASVYIKSIFARTHENQTGSDRNISDIGNAGAAALLFYGQPHGPFPLFAAGLRKACRNHLYAHTAHRPLNARQKRRGGKHGAAELGAALLLLGGGKGFPGTLQERCRLHRKQKAVELLDAHPADLARTHAHAHAGVQAQKLRKFKRTRTGEHGKCAADRVLGLFRLQKGRAGLAFAGAQLAGNGKQVFDGIRFADPKRDAVCQLIAGAGRVDGAVK